MPLYPISKSSDNVSLLAPKGGQYTLNQLIALQVANKWKNDRSFAGDLFEGGKGGVIWSLKQILRPSLAVTTGLYRGLEGEGAFDVSDALSGAKRGFQLKDHKTGSNILTELGWSGGGKLKSLAGFGVDVVTDPLLMLQVGAVIATGGGAAPAILAGRAALAGFAKAGTTVAAKHTMAKEAVAVLSKEGADFSARKALARLEEKRLGRELKDETLSEPEMLELSVAREFASQEQKANVERVLQLQLGVPFKRGKKIPLSPKYLGGEKISGFGETIQEGGQRVALSVPSLTKNAKGGGIVGKIPGAKTAARQLGYAFKHGFNEESWAKPLLMVAHMGEKLYDDYFRVAHNRLGTHFRILSSESQRHALSWAQKRETLVIRNKRGVGRLNQAELDGAVRRQAITQEEANFLKDWHEYWEYQAARDRIFGVTYEKQLGNKIYIPHIYQRNGARITKSDVAKAIPGYTKERIEDLTVEEMYRASISEYGRRNRWISDPRELVAIRSRRGAQAHAMNVLMRHMRRAAGVPARVHDADRYLKYQVKLHNQERRFTDNAWSVNSRLVGARRAKITKAAKRALDAKRAEIDAKFAPRYAALRESFDRNLLSETAVISEVKKVNALHEKAYKRVEAKIKKDQLEALEKLNREIESGWRELAWANDAVVKINKLVERGFYKRNPNIPEGWEKLAKKLDGEYYHFPPELHDAMTRVEMSFRNDVDMEKLVGTWNEAIAKWKVGVTSVNPGYRIRNTLSDVWNMYIAGVPMWAIPVYAAKANKLQMDAAKIGRKLEKTNGLYVPTAAEKKTLNIILEAHSHGILSGLFGGDVETVARLLAQGRKATTEAQTGHLIRSYTRMMGAWNRRWEDKGRLTHYLYRREYEKLGVVDSADWVKKAHFDYTELTATEREKFKKFIPFYTWTRKNIPYQLTQMLARPGKYATFPKAINMFEEMAENEDGEMAQPGLLPSWMQERMAFRVPFFGQDAMALPMVGVTDLQKIDPTQSLGEAFMGGISMVNPFMKVPFEIATGRNLLTGQELNEGSRVPISGGAASILKWIPGADIGPTSRQVRGERVEDVGASPWVKYLSSQLPMANFLVNAESKVANERRGKGMAILGYIGGVPIYNRDLEAEEVAALLENKDRVSSVVRSLRRSGVIPPSKSKRSKFEENILLPALRGG